MIQALREGILILIVPPTLMSVIVIVVAYTKRNQYRRIDEADWIAKPERTGSAEDTGLPYSQFSAGILPENRS
ncbi:MAG TPA: hypothetical protein VL128_17020 [Candidatus Eisenbacteria bacterium]|nr:hypothetical protein [Candidatus Eisenbacteria bacterium]